MPMLDPLLTIADTLAYEADQALELGEIGAARGLLGVLKVAMVAAEPDSIDTESITQAIQALAEERPELAHVLGEIAELVEQIQVVAASRRRSGERPCKACSAGLECPAPGCEDLVETGDPDGPW